MFDKKYKDAFFSNTLVIAATELVMMHGGMELMALVYGPLFDFTPADPLAAEAFTYGLFYFTFLIPIGICLLYIRLTRPEKLKQFTKGGLKGFLKAMAIGILTGFGMNALISALTGITGTVSFSFNTFTWYMPLLAVLAFFQCSCEEFLLRGYAAPYTEERNDWSTAAFISGALFIFHHTGNLDLYGFDVFFCLNVFLIGVFLYLLVKVTGNFWSCCGFHTAWNVTQMYLFGLPNSGMSSPVSLFLGNDAKDNFFFNTVYGNEGSACTSVLTVIGILILLRIWKKQQEAKQNG